MVDNLWTFGFEKLSTLKITPIAKFMAKGNLPLNWWLVMWKLYTRNISCPTIMSQCDICQTSCCCIHNYLFRATCNLGKWLCMGDYIRWGECLWYVQGWFIRWWNFQHHVTCRESTFSIECIYNMKLAWLGPLTPSLCSCQHEQITIHAKALGCQWINRFILKCKPYHHLKVFFWQITMAKVSKGRKLYCYTFSTSPFWCMLTDANNIS